MTTCHADTIRLCCFEQAALLRQADLQRGEERQQQEALEAHLRAVQQVQAAELAAVRCATHLSLTTLRTGAFLPKVSRCADVISDEVVHRQHQQEPHSCSAHVGKWFATW